MIDIYAANVSEDDLADDGANNPHVANVRKLAAEEGSEVFVICAQIEQEIAELDDDNNLPSADVTAPCAFWYCANFSGVRSAASTLI